MNYIAAFCDYLSLERNYSKHTVVAYRKDVLSFCEFSLECDCDFDLNTANYSQIRSWIVSLSNDGLANKSINRKLSSLKSYYKYLLKIGVVTTTPMAIHKALKVERKVQLPFSQLEMEEVLDDVEFKNDFEGVRDYLIIHLLYVTGMRRAELINLQVADVDFELRVLKVLGKRNKERLLPLSDKTLLIVKRYLEFRSEVSLNRSERSLLISKRGVKIYPTLVYRVINSYFSKVSSKFKKSPHVLRHTFATHLLNNGADLNAVKELLGHTSLAATQVYTHNSMEKLKRVYRDSHPRNRN